MVTQFKDDFKNSFHHYGLQPSSNVIAESHFRFTKIQPLKIKFDFGHPVEAGLHIDFFQTLMHISRLH